MSRPHPSRVIVRLVLLAGVVAAALVYLIATSEALPGRVAAHFAIGGQADGWMDRGHYITDMAVVMVALPLGSTLLLAVLRLLPVDLINIPNRAYWLAPAQRAGTYRVLLILGADLGIAEALMIAALHAMILNAQDRTDILSDWSWKIALALVVMILVRLIWFVRSFRHLP